MWSFLLKGFLLLVLKNKLCVNFLRHSNESSCSVAKRLSTQKQHHSMIWIQAIFVPLLRFWQTWANPDRRVTERPYGTALPAIALLGRAALCKSQLRPISFLAAFWNTAVLEYSLVTLLHRLGESTRYAQLVLFISMGRAGVCTSDLQNFFRKANLRWTAEELLVGRSMHFSLRTAAATVKPTTLLRSQKKPAQTSLYVVSWKIQQCIWNFFKVYPQKNKHCGHYQQFLKQEEKKGSPREVRT